MTDRIPAKPLTLLTKEQREALLRQSMSRRSVLQKPGQAAAAITTGVVVTGASGTAVATLAAQEATPELAEDGYAFNGVPPTPAEPPPQAFVALTAEEAAVVETLTARMMPGNESDPGAREAGVVYYIDHLLSASEGLHEAVYREGPWPQPYQGEESPAEEEGTVWVNAEDLGRYGYQSPLTPLDVYQIGVAATNQHAIDTYGTTVAQLSDEDQDAVVWDLLRGDAAGFDQFSSFSFFQTLRLHTAEGMFSDPAYGGNRNMAGWKLVGFPGAQRAYLPDELRSTDPPRPPQSMNDLPHFHPGENEDVDNLVLPVRGTEDEEAGE